MPDTPKAPPMPFESTDEGLPIGTVEDILEKAPSDVEEKVIEVPEWGCSVKVRGLTGAQLDRVGQVADARAPKGSTLSLIDLHIQQFLEGVVAPKFNEPQARKLHNTSGRGFAKIISAIDDVTGAGEEELETAKRRFPGEGQ